MVGEAGFEAEVLAHIATGLYCVALCFLSSFQYLLPDLWISVDLTDGAVQLSREGAGQSVF